MGSAGNLSGGCRAAWFSPDRREAKWRRGSESARLPIEDWTHPPNPRSSPRDRASAAGVRHLWPCLKTQPPFVARGGPDGTWDPFKTGPSCLFIGYPTSGERQGNGIPLRTAVGAGAASPDAAGWIIRRRAATCAAIGSPTRKITHCLQLVVSLHVIGCAVRHFSVTAK